MDRLSYFKQNIFQSILTAYPHCIIDDKKSDNSSVVLRLPIENAEAAEELQNFISNVTNSAWIVYYKKPHLEKVIFSKTWACQHNKKNKSKSNSKRNAECPAKLRIVIKKITRYTSKSDKCLTFSPPLTGEVKLDLEHKHNTIAAAALKMLRVNKEVKESFNEYFSNGLGPAEAMHYHENALLLAENYEDVGNASLNPTRRQVTHLYNIWRDHNLGSFINPLEMLRKKLELYESKGATVRISNDESWSVVVVTKVMERLHSYVTCKEMVYVDTTSSCEATSCSITILLASVKIGALPLAVLIHPSQTMENYENAFKLLKDSFPKCFGGLEHPEIFMTDDSSAEKGALKLVWPNSLQLLCHFHVAQAEWRWLFSHPEEVPKNERPRLMKLFQAVMYATTKEKLSEAVQNIKKEGKYPKFVQRFEKFFQRKDEWLLLSRQQLLTRQNNTNNFAEATMRILKDIVLCRTRAFNVVALVDFCISMWEPYLIRKLMDYANSRRGEVQIMYHQFLRKTEDFLPENIKMISPGLFSISSNSDNTYIVNADIGICSCPSAVSGAFCKHQFFLMKEKKIPFLNAPPMSASDRHELAVLALGKKCPDPRFYDDFIEDETSFCVVDQLKTVSCGDAVSDTCTDNLKENKTEVANEDQKEEMKKELSRISKLLDSEIDENTAKRFLRTLKKVQNVEDLNKIYFFKSKTQKKIKVQPTSIARRRPGLSKTSKRIPSGRPPSIINKNTRKRNLTENILKNQPNAKSHNKLN